MKKIVLLRHGESAWNKENRFTGWTDVDLTEKGIAEANKEAVVLALENVVSFDVDNQSITWHEFIDLDIIGNKQRRLLVYDLFNLGYGNDKTLFKRLNMVGISKEDVLKKLDEHKERVNG